ncbi:MAG TPA: response regulator [Rhizomicrobium sp.]|nr:response regulator [Rhizomicrobium sp.]
MAESRNSRDGTETATSTIMVVEPDVLARQVIAEYLRECGYRVLEGVTADDVLAVLKAKERVDIIFAEVRLSGALDGFGLAKLIRETHPEIDVLLTSGVAKAAEKAGDLCEEGPLEKPYHPQEVERRIKLLRERRRTTKKPLE